MKCGRCRKSGHNRTTCPQHPQSLSTTRLPPSPPNELMRMLIDPRQALALVTEGTAGAALANATRQIGAMNRDGLGHLACNDILTALAELELRARQLAPATIESVQSTHTAIESAKAALAAAECAHARSKAEVLVALGYREKDLGFRVGIVEEVPSS